MLAAPRLCPFRTCAVPLLFALLGGCEEPASTAVEQVRSPLSRLEPVPKSSAPAVAEPPTPVDAGAALAVEDATSTDAGPTERDYSRGELIKLMAKFVPRTGWCGVGPSDPWRDFVELRHSDATLRELQAVFELTEVPRNRSLALWALARYDTPEVRAFFVRLGQQQELPKEAIPTVVGVLLKGDDAMRSVAASRWRTSTDWSLALLESEAFPATPEPLLEVLADPDEAANVRRKAFARLDAFKHLLQVDLWEDANGAPAARLRAAALAAPERLPVAAALRLLRDEVPDIRRLAAFSIAERYLRDSESANTVLSAVAHSDELRRSFPPEAQQRLVAAAEFRGFLPLAAALYRDFIASGAFDGDACEAPRLRLADVLLADGLYEEAEQVLDGYQGAKWACTRFADELPSWARNRLMRADDPEVPPTLENLSRWSASSMRITLALEPGRRKHGQVWVTVRNDGTAPLRLELEKSGADRAVPLYVWLDGVPLEVARTGKPTRPRVSPGQSHTFQFDLPRAVEPGNHALQIDLRAAPASDPDASFRARRLVRFDFP